MPVNGQEHLHADERRSPEHLRHERLVALLRDVAETRGKVKAAEALGVSFRTLARAVESGRLTGRMADALERHLLEVEGSVTAPVRQKQADGVEERMEQLEADVAELRLRVETIRAVVGALQEDQARTLRQWEDRLARVEARRVVRNGSGAASTPSVKGALEGPRRAAAGEASQASLPPAGNSWSPRRVRSSSTVRRCRPSPSGGRHEKPSSWRSAGSTSWLPAQRIVELEVRLVGDHELTLPPAVYPWDRADRRDEVWRRTQSLGDIRVDRSRALLWRWVRRVLTLGLWWR